MHKVQYVSIKGKMMTLKNTLNAYLLPFEITDGFLAGFHALFSEYGPGYPDEDEDVEEDTEDDRTVERHQSIFLTDEASAEGNVTL